MADPNGVRISIDKLTNEQQIYNGGMFSAMCVGDYPSHGGTPSYGGTPMATPHRRSFTAARASTDGVVEGPRRSATLILKSALNAITGSTRVANEGRLSDADELQHHYNAYFEEARTSNATGSPLHNVPFSLAGAIQIPETGRYSDVEAPRAYAFHAVEEECEDYIELTHIAKPVLNNRKPPLRINLKFVDVKYKVTLQEAKKWRGKLAIEKEILYGVSGDVASGEMLAMMGPSGSGKTTFLNLLGGRRSNPLNVNGSILYNDLPYTKKLKRRMGFVTQDDVLFPHLTVRETLTFCAMLRLGRELRKEEKVGRAEEVISQLGLRKCADTVIGNQFLRGVSGGERKRVCIGQEILVDPSLLFLDEPTSGLDSTTTLRLIKLLQQLAHEGRTVVTTIHQPSSRAFHMFDKLLLLSEGHGIYFGKAREAMTYFDSIGFSPLIPMNPADFLIDLCSGNTTDISFPSTLKQPSFNSSRHLDPLITKNRNFGASTPPLHLVKDVKKYLVECYKNQMTIEKVSKTKNGEALVESKDVAVMSKEEATWETRLWGTTWWEQFVILLVRGFKERRHEYLSVLRIVQVVASALLAGCLWWRSKYSTPSQLQDQVGLIFFIAVFWGYLPLFTAIFTFPLERAMLAKERSSDMYRLSAFFMARTLGDLPLDLALPFIFTVILYFMANLQQTLSAFLLSLLTIFLTVVTSQGFGLFIGAAMMDVQKATTFASISILAFMLAGGFFVKSIPHFISWIKYFSFQAYTFNILIQIQYQNDKSYNCQSVDGCQSIASATALQNTSLHDATKSSIALLIMVFGYRFLAYVALRRMKTTN